STIKVNGEATGEASFSESDPAAPGDAYAVSKWEAETALFGIAAQGPMEAVVLRPPLVYGRRVGGNFLALLKICRLAPPLPLGAVSNRRSLIYAGNLADAIIRCLAHADAAGRTFLVGDGDDVSTPELIRRVGAALGRPARLFGVPEPLLRAAGRATGKSEIVARLLDSLRVDDGQIRRDLDWAPPFTMAQGLDATAAWFTSPDGS
ncbi:MAG: NAD-dependent epimerase/dehydratase family protein, partial [Proteobacteria bacterium]|nr:NAD-dependent epimerase/dehydratase family protein [Pseudomonadota bacterium]